MELYTRTLGDWLEHWAMRHIGLKPLPIKNISSIQIVTCVLPGGNSMSVLIIWQKDCLPSASNEILM